MTPSSQETFRDRLAPGSALRRWHYPLVAAVASAVMVVSSLSFQAAAADDQVPADPTSEPTTEPTSARADSSASTDPEPSFDPGASIDPGAATDPTVSSSPRCTGGGAHE